MRSKERKTYRAFVDKASTSLSPNVHPIYLLSTEPDEISRSKNNLQLLNKNQQLPAIHSEKLQMLLRENN
jgi:hypothetical protein